MSITAEIAATVAQHNIVEHKVKDKYGRSVSEFHIYDRETKSSSTVVLCTLPKVAREADPTKQYIVNNWEKRHYEETSHWYFANRNEAKKFALAELVASHAKKLAAV
ncbi:hypothetical protein SEA_SICARIUS2_79 [Arthrobacter phage Sicarius2]|uniref:Uncharacterized protein n=1 Tax=Arthrobacter phage Sicarius2 TaxID=2836090 RepID=A0A8F3IP05_9CAUD|nr:hypothetical protein SEA_SICARIUS2_79 [Arthrobacter phage Sicarius2]